MPTDGSLSVSTSMYKAAMTLYRPRLDEPRHLVDSIEMLPLDFSVEDKKEPPRKSVIVASLVDQLDSVHLDEQQSQESVIVASLVDQLDSV